MMTIRASAQKILDHWKKFEWRHHGLGMLQAEFDYHHRVHIWHPDLRMAAVDEPFRDVHDHRFDLRSDIITGEILDISYEVVTRPPPGSYDRAQRFAAGALEAAGAWAFSKAWAIVNAKAQESRIAAGEPVVEKLCDVCVRETGSRSFWAGQSYTIARRAFHTTRIAGLAVTCVTRSNFDTAPARVLGEMPRFAITSRKNFDEVQPRVLEQAHARLTELAGPNP